MVEISKEDLVLLLIAILAQGYITPHLPELPDSGLTPLLNDPTTQSVLSIVVVFLVLRSGWHYGKNLLSKDDDTGSGFGFKTVSRPPSKTLYTTLIQYDRVDWRGDFGITRGNEVTYVKGPYCPHCESKLSMKTKSRRIRSKQKLWKCPSCHFSASRETDTRDSQREMVEKIVGNEASVAVRNILVREDPEIQETIRDILENATEREPEIEDFMENPSPDRYSDEVKEAIVGALEEKIDEDEVRRNPKLRVVLRKEFDYSLPKDNRTYEIIDEQVNESEVKRHNR